MDAGQLDRVVVIEQRSTERDADYGSDAGRWEDYATVRAEIVESLTAPGSNPTAEAMVDGYARPHRVTIRWRSDFDKSRMRLRYDGRILKVTATAEQGRRQWLVLACQEWAHEQ